MHQVRLHSTRLMPSGEVSLWHDGRLTWRGLLGSRHDGILFDTIALSTIDAERLLCRLSFPSSCRAVLAAIAEWWEDDAVRPTSSVP